MEIFITAKIFFVFSLIVTCVCFGVCMYVKCVVMRKIYDLRCDVSFLATQLMDFIPMGSRTKYESQKINSIINFIEEGKTLWIWT